MHTCRFHNCLVVFKFLLFHELFTKHQNQNSKHVRHQVKPFSFALQKLRLFETMCSMLPTGKFGHFLPVFCLFYKERLCPRTNRRVLSNLLSARSLLSHKGASKMLRATGHVRMVKEGSAGGRFACL